MNMEKFRKLTVKVLLALLIGVLGGTSVHAQTTKWFPYFQKAGNTGTTQGTTVWGSWDGTYPPVNHEFFSGIIVNDEFTRPDESIYYGQNPVFGVKDVFYTGGTTCNGTNRSWYETLRGTTGRGNHAIHIYNPNINPAVNFSGSNVLRLYIYDKDGIQVNESTLYNRACGTNTQYLLNTNPSYLFPSGTGLAWNTSGDYFEITLNAGKSIVLNSEDATQMFLAPGGSNGVWTDAFQGSIKIVQPSVNNYDFVATIKGEGYNKSRISTSAFSSTLSSPFGYAYAAEQAPAGTSVLRLPYFKCIQNISSTTQSTSENRIDRDDLIYFVNTSGATNDYLIEIFDKDGVQQAYTWVQLAANERFNFSPAQMKPSTYYNDGDVWEGSVEISGAMPVAMCHSVRYTPIWGQSATTPVGNVPTSNSRPASRHMAPDHDSLPLYYVP